MSRTKHRPLAEGLVLRLPGTRVPADQFAKAFQAFLGLLEDVSDSVAGLQSAIQWEVSASRGSVLLEFSPAGSRAPEAVVRQAVDAVRDGLLVIAQRPERPLHWSDRALRKAKDLAESVTTAADKPVTVIFSGQRDPLPVPRALGGHVETLIGTTFSALGSIEGRLRTVSEGGGLHFVVQDALTQNQVRCFVREDRQPASIRVQRFRVLRESKELPSAADVRGILA
jgi:hypothetical protein